MEQRAILMAEADNDLQRIRWLALHRLGFHVHPARSGHDALELLKQSSTFSAAVIALDLPGLDGLSLASTFRLEAPHSAVRLIAVASEDSARERERALHAGFDAFVPGRCETDLLCEVVTGLMTSRAEPGPRRRNRPRAPLPPEDDIHSLREWLQRFSPEEVRERAARFWMEAEQELAIFRAAVQRRSRYEAAKAARSLARACRKVGLRYAAATAERARSEALVNASTLDAEPQHLARAIREGYALLLGLTRP